MIIDASAILAILRDEPEALPYAKAIASTSGRRVSAVNYVEAAVVIDGWRNPVASRRFDDFFREAEIVVEPVTEAQARIAREACRDFGKGSGHPAGLNSGTASPMPWPRRLASRFCSRGMISRTRISRRCSRELSGRDESAVPLPPFLFAIKAKQLILLKPELSADRRRRF